jgi:ABC-2 type transport system permease protein
VIAAELHKALATRSVWWLGVAAALASAAWAVVHVLLWLGAGAATDVEDAYSMAQQGYLFAMIAGVLLVAGEYRHKTVTWVLLVSPRRSRVVVAKLVACAVTGLAYGLAAAAATVVAVLVAGGALWAPGVPLALAGSVAGTALWTVFGGALGALVRNQFAAVVVAFEWFYYAEWALVSLVPAVGRWTPTGAAKAVSGWTRDAMPVAGDLLPAWAGGTLFLGYAVVAAALAAATTLRRDVV